MKLLVILLCLLSERFLIHSLSFKRFSWFGDYAQLMLGFGDKKTSSVNAWFSLAMVVMPVLLAVAIVYLFLQGIFWGLMGFILNVVIFMYCLGPQNAFYPSGSSINQELDSTGLAGNYFALVNSQLYSVIFWFVCTGPIGLLSYRLINLCKNIEPISQQATDLNDIIEWIPARLTVLLYLMVGNFQSGFESFKHYMHSKPDLNTTMLRECGIKALTSNESTDVSVTIAEGLVEQATIVLLVLIALGTLVAWL